MECSVLSWLEGDIELMNTNGSPTACQRISTSSLTWHLRIFKSMMNPNKCITACIKSIYFLVTEKIGIMISSFPIFSFVKDSIIFYFYFAYIEISLEISHVVHSIPKAKFNQGKKG